MVAETLMRAGDDAGVQKTLAIVADGARPAWQRAAILRGAEVALLGAVAPGTPPVRRATTPAAGVPCPTCPGGRAGPGGAYAFAQVADPPRGRGRGPARRL